MEIRLANQRQKEEMARHQKEIEKAEEKARKDLEKSETKALKEVDKKEAETQKAEKEAASNPPEADQPQKKKGFGAFGKAMFGKKKKQEKQQAQPTDWNQVRSLIIKGYDEKYAGLDAIAGQVKNSFQNAATFYFSAIHYEAREQWDDAFIDYKRALEIDPDNPYVIQDTLRLAKQLGRNEDLKALQTTYPTQKTVETPKSSANLVVIFEEGLAPKKEEIKLDIPVAGQLVSIATPTYSPQRQEPTPLLVINGRHLGRTEPICDIQVLAVKALKEEAPLRTSRQISRMITKGVATKVLENKAGFLGTLAGSAYGSATEHADLRSWLTLPGNIQIARFPIHAGEQEITLKQTTGMNQSVTIHPQAGQTIILQVIRVNGKDFVNPIYMNPQGA